MERHYGTARATKAFRIGIFRPTAVAASIDMFRVTSGERSVPRAGSTADPTCATTSLTCATADPMATVRFTGTTGSEHPSGSAMVVGDRPSVPAVSPSTTAARLPCLALESGGERLNGGFEFRFRDE